MLLVPESRWAAIIADAVVLTVALLLPVGCSGDDDDAQSPESQLCVADIAVDGEFTLDAYHEYKCYLSAWQRSEESVTIQAVLSEGDGTLRLRIFSLGDDADGQTFNAAFAFFPAENLAAWSVWDTGWPTASCTAAIDEQLHLEDQNPEATLIDATATCPSPLLPGTVDGPPPSDLAPITVQRLRVRSIYGPILGR
ncbi:MAG: hypothetical protein DRI90_10965 [Deltaproteobacteria bacterium]|nr:MAG: hypothetical protein DRI90_10965 [Deltaproteobacteria bacterium]